MLTETVHRARLLLTLTGLAWLLGLTPPAPVRLLLAALAVAGMAADAVADRYAPVVTLTRLPGRGWTR